MPGPVRVLPVARAEAKHPGLETDFHSFDHSIFRPDAVSTAALPGRCGRTTNRLAGKAALGAQNEQLIFSAVDQIKQHIDLLRNNHG